MKAPKQEQKEQERALNEVSVAQWTDYVARYQPAEAELIKRSELTAGERASLKGQVAGDVSSAFKGLTRDTLATSEQSGAGIESGKAKFSLAANADAKGRALGTGQVLAERGAEVARDQQQAGISALGRGIAADVTQNMARGARIATRVGMAEAAGRFSRNSQLLDTSAAVAGAAWKKWGVPYMEQRADQKRLEAGGMTVDKSFLPTDLDAAFPDRYNPFGD